MRDTKSEAKSFRQIVGEAIGEASMCWSEIPTGVFESTRASAIVDKIFDAFHLEAGMNVTRWVNLKAELQSEREKLATACELLKDATGYIFLLTQPADDRGIFGEWDDKCKPFTDRIKESK